MPAALPPRQKLQRANNRHGIDMAAAAILTRLMATGGAWHLALRHRLSVPHAGLLMMLVGRRHTSAAVAGTMRPR